MKAATLSMRHTIEENVAVFAKPRLIAEWEYNRFQVPTVTVTPDQTGDEEWIAAYGDLDSVGLPNRPRTGIAKARSDSGIEPLGKYRDSPNAARFYPSGPQDQYSYFSSIQTTGSDNTFGTPITLEVAYPVPVYVNKIVLGFETSYARPVNYSIQVTPDGGGWFTITDNAALESDGTVTMWFDGDTWQFGESYDHITSITAVRVVVYSMDKPSAHVDILQLGARLENDLSNYVVGYTTQLEVADRSFIAPMGKASANQATVTLSNVDGRFNNENSASLYYGMVDKRVRFTLDLGIDTTDQGGTGFEYIREFTMWTDSWGTSGTTQTELEVELKDSSVLLQEMDMPNMFMENVSVGSVIWTIMDRLGFTNYTYSRSTEDAGEVLPYYWPDVSASTTVWDEISSLAEGTQTAVFFDEHDVMQIRPRQAMYADKTVDWNFDAIPNGTKLPDIVSTETSYDLETNQVDITYRPTYISTDNNGFPKMEQVWAPENTLTNSGHTADPNQDNSVVTLRAAALVRDMSFAATDMWISPSLAAFWPWESDVNIEGEILHYKGKEYAYYGSDGVTHWITVNTLSEQDNLDKLNPDLSFKNFYTGRLMVSARGVYGTSASDHKISPDGYTSLVTSWDNTILHAITGAVAQHDGYITQTNVANSGSRFTIRDSQTIHLRKHESSVPPLTAGGSVRYGAKIRFPTTPATGINGPYKMGGIFIGGDDVRGGYYLNILSTDQINLTGRTGRNEISIFAFPGSGGVIGYVGTNGDNRGYQVNILEGIWYQLDVKLTVATNKDTTIDAYLNGVACGSWVIPGTKVPNYNTNWRFGTFVRGPSYMDIEYLYAVAEDDSFPFRDPDSTNFLDLTTGGFVSGFLDKEVKYNFRSITPYSRYASGRTISFPQRIDTSHFVFDEYGPVVHEVRKFNVAFDTSKAPVLNSSLYLTNESAQQLYYNSDAFGAEFMIANGTRDNIIINGEDTLTFGPDNSVTQSMFVYGRSVYQDTEKTVSKEDSASVRRRGASKTTFDNRYVQSDDLANSLADFVLDLWAGGVDEVTLESFGNVLIQLGDLVTINYPTKAMTPTTHKYFVTAINGEFNQGYKSTFTLRRARV